MMFGRRLNKLGSAIKSSRPSPQASFNFALANESLDSRITYSGASARMRFDSTGTLQYAPMNLIRNNTMVGAVAGTPGSSPTNWSITTTNAELVSSVVGTGIEDGIAYIDINIAGTVTSSRDFDVRFEAIGQVAAVSGQQWTQYFYLRQVGGSQANITGIFSQANTYTAALAYVNTPLLLAETVTTAALRTQRRSRTFSLSGGTIAFVAPFLKVTTAASGAVDITLRIGLPQLQLGSVATDPIPTTSAAVYLPRSNAYQDHNPSTLAPLGFLIEEQRTNSIRNNTMVGAVAGTPGTDPTNWAITNSGAGLTKQIVGTGVEDGIAYVDVRYSGTGSGSPILQITPETTTGVTSSVGQVWTASYYLRVVGGSTSGVLAWTTVWQERDAAGVSLTVASTADAGAPTTSALRTQRRQVTRTLTDAAAVRLTNRLQIQCDNVAIDITLRIGLPQLELGAFATSPILTTTAAATRLADVASIAGTNFSSFWNQSEGTIVSSTLVGWNVGAADFPRWWEASDGTSNNFVTVATTNNLGVYEVRAGGVVQSGLYPALSENIVNKFAVAYKANDFACSLNGATALSSVSGSVPTVDRINIGRAGTATGWLNGHIQSLTYYNRRLPNSTLQSLTV